MFPCAMPVPGFDDYLVTDDGRVWSKKSYRGTTGRWLKPTPNAHGYSVVSLRKDGKTYVRKVHLLVLEAFTGSRPEGFYGCHGPNGKGDNSLANLYWDTPKNNSSRDKLRDGTLTLGEKNGRARLSEKDVEDIRLSHSSGEATYKQLAARYGVAWSTIGNIVRGDSWTSV